jgi:uncharacterized protein with HEPN domain
MPANRDRASLLDILQAALQIQRSAAGVSQAQLEANDEKQAAILYRIIVIGEATKRISADFRDQHPQIPWREMAGMRDQVSHAYDRVDLAIVWDVVQYRIPELIALLQSLLSPE